MTIRLIISIIIIIITSSLRHHVKILLYILLPLVVCRLRVSEDLAGMGPPLYEDQTLLEADIARGATLVLEPGPVPLRSQVR